jgi:hypothetical protein
VLDNPGSGFVPLGYVRGSDPVIWANTLPLLGDLEQLQSLIRNHVADCLFVASSALTFEDISWVAQAARKEGVEVRVSANLPRMLTSRLCFQTVGRRSPSRCGRCASTAARSCSARVRPAGRAGRGPRARPSCRDPRPFASTRRSRAGRPARAGSGSPSCASTALAIMLLLETDGVLYYLKGGYDPAFERCSPGMVLLSSVIEHAFGNGIGRVDLLGGDERYKLAFTSDVKDKRRFQAFAPSPLGLLSRTAFSYGRPVARRVLDMARPGRVARR